MQLGDSSHDDNSNPLGMEYQSNDDNPELEWLSEPGSPVRRIGRSKATGIVLIELKLDEHGREIEKTFYGDDGVFSKRIAYEYDQERKPRLVSVFNQGGHLIWRQERGKRPESYS